MSFETNLQREKAVRQASAPVNLPAELAAPVLDDTRLALSGVRDSVETGDSQSVPRPRPLSVREAAADGAVLADALAQKERAFFDAAKAADKRLPDAERAATYAAMNQASAELGATIAAAEGKCVEFEVRFNESIRQYDAAPSADNTRKAAQLRHVYEKNVNALREKIADLRLMETKFYSGTVKIGRTVDNKTEEIKNKHFFNELRTYGSGFALLKTPKLIEDVPELAQLAIPGPNEIIEKLDPETKRAVAEAITELYSGGIGGNLSHGPFDGENASIIISNPKVKGAWNKAHDQLFGELEGKMKRVLGALERQSLTAQQEQAVAILNDTVGNGWVDFKESNKRTVQDGAFSLTVGIAGFALAAGVTAFSGGLGTPLGVAIAAGTSALVGVGTTWLNDKYQGRERSLGSFAGSSAIDGAFVFCNLGLFHLAAKFGYAGATAAQSAKNLSLLSARGATTFGMEAGGATVLGTAADKTRAAMEGESVSWGDSFGRNLMWALMPLMVGGRMSGGYLRGTAETLSGKGGVIGGAARGVVRGGEGLDAGFSKVGSLLRKKDQSPSEAVATAPASEKEIAASERILARAQEIETLLRLGADDKAAPLIRKLADDLASKRKFSNPAIQEIDELAAKSKGIGAERAALEKKHKWSAGSTSLRSLEDELAGLKFVQAVKAIPDAEAQAFAALVTRDPSGRFNGVTDTVAMDAWIRKNGLGAPLATASVRMVASNVDQAAASLKNPKFAAELDNDVKAKGKGIEAYKEYEKLGVEMQKAFGEIAAKRTTVLAVMKSYDDVLLAREKGRIDFEKADLAKQKTELEAGRVKAETDARASKPFEDAEKAHAGAQAEHSAAETAYNALVDVSKKERVDAAKLSAVEQAAGDWGAREKALTTNKQKLALCEGKKTIAEQKKGNSTNAKEIQTLEREIYALDSEILGLKIHVIMDAEANLAEAKYKLESAIRAAKLDRFGDLATLNTAAKVIARAQEYGAAADALSTSASKLETAKQALKEQETWTKAHEAADAQIKDIDEKLQALKDEGTVLTDLFQKMEKGRLAPMPDAVKKFYIDSYKKVHEVLRADVRNMRAGDSLQVGEFTVRPDKGGKFSIQGGEWDLPQLGFTEEALVRELTANLRGSDLLDYQVRKLANAASGKTGRDLAAPAEGVFKDGKLKGKEFKSVDAAGVEKTMTVLEVNAEGFPTKLQDKKTGKILAGKELEAVEERMFAGLCDKYAAKYLEEQLAVLRAKAPKKMPTDAECKQMEKETGTSWQSIKATFEAFLKNPVTVGIKDFAVKGTIPGKIPLISGEHPYLLANPLANFASKEGKQIAAGAFKTLIYALVIANTTLPDEGTWGKAFTFAMDMSFNSIFALFNICSRIQDQR